MNKTELYLKGIISMEGTSASDLLYLVHINTLKHKILYIQHFIYVFFSELVVAQKKKNIFTGEIEFYMNKQTVIVFSDILINDLNLAHAP